MQLPLEFFVFTFMPLAVIGMIVWTYRRARRMLEEWVTSAGFELVSASVRLLRRGPFFWTSSKNQIVYRIAIVDHDSLTRDGWARCGSFWWGVFTKQVEVCWDDES